MRNERGVVLVIAVLIMITATFLGIAAVMTSDIEVRMSGNQRSMETALYAADGG
ncbi:MAG: PilX N-terminal domain-containing pilus assembly protein, partial [Thermodesulfobacteriota bacterium]